MNRILNSLKSRKSFSQETHTYTLSVDRSVTEETILSIATRWQRIPPLGVQIMKWRKIQICRYLKEFPDHGPSKIMCCYTHTIQTPSEIPLENIVDIFLHRNQVTGYYIAKIVPVCFKILPHLSVDVISILHT